MNNISNDKNIGLPNNTNITLSINEKINILISRLAKIVSNIIILNLLQNPNLLFIIPIVSYKLPSSD